MQLENTETYDMWHRQNTAFRLSGCDISSSEQCLHIVDHQRLHKHFDPHMLHHVSPLTKTVRFFWFLQVTHTSALDYQCTYGDLLVDLAREKWSRYSRWEERMEEMAHLLDLLGDH